MSEPEVAAAGAPVRAGRGQQLLLWAIALACFAYLYYRIAGAATREGLTVASYLAQVFSEVSWGGWLALMIPYSIFFFLIDSAVVWRVITWFNASVTYRGILPIRASAYIISIFNEQAGKGAMALYLNRRDGVPGWEVGSSMLFIMFCEFYYLLAWAVVGYALAGDRLPAEFRFVPLIALGAAAFFVVFVLYFRGTLLPALDLRDRPLFLAFRRAKPWQYGVTMLIRSPAILAAVVVYTLSLRLFGVEASFSNMLGLLPVIFFAAAVPTPMRAAAITIWVLLFPENEGQITAFGFVMHNFFIFFNAAIGLVFLRRARRDLFG